MINVPYGEVSLHSQFGPPTLKAIVKFVEVRLSLRDVAFETGNVLAFNAAIYQICKRHICAVDQLAERYLEMPCNRLDLARTLRGDLLKKRVECVLDESLLHACTIGNMVATWYWRADGRECQFGQICRLTDRQ